MTIATVLFAVAMSSRATRRPMPSCPPFLPRKILWMVSSRTSKPPFSRISAHIAETRIATMQVSNIPEVPDPMLESISHGVVCPVPSMISAPETMPVKSTRKT